MRIKRFDNTEEALWSLAGNNKRYILIPRELTLGEETELHFSGETDSWLIISVGKLGFRPGGEEDELLCFSERVSVIHFPKHEEQSLRMISPARYFILESCGDEDEEIDCLYGRDEEAYCL